MNADDLSSTLAQKREEDKRKGRAVVKQLVRIIFLARSDASFPQHTYAPGRDLRVIVIVHFEFYNNVK